MFSIELTAHVTDLALEGGVSLRPGTCRCDSEVVGNIVHYARWRYGKWNNQVRHTAK